MNIYTTEFFSVCPNNGARIKYELTIETARTIMAEDLIECVSLHEKGYHEEIAEQIFHEFGGLQTLIADHHGVNIKTVRGRAAPEVRG